MTKLFKTQEAVYKRLLEDDQLVEKVRGIYDYVPKESDYPFVVLSQAYTTPYTTKTTFGEQIEIQLDIWSTYHGQKETTSIAQLIQGSLTSDLSVDGAFILSQEIKSIEVVEEDTDLYRGSLVCEILLDVE